VAKYRKVEDFELNQWISHLRVLYRRGQLQKEKIQILESLPNWTWGEEKTLEGRWNIGFSLTEKHGVVKFDTVVDDFNLGQWQRVQREDYKDDRITKDRVKKLESVDGWMWDRREYYHQWDLGLKLSMKYGTVSAKFVTPDGFTLGTWQCNHRQTVKDEDKRKLLESIPGWYWDSAATAILRGVEYTKKYGVVSRRFVTEDGYKLGVWQSNTRRKCKYPELLKDLKSIPGWKING